MTHIVQWEYLIVDREGFLSDKWEGEKISLQDFLTRKGLDGWELVQGPSYGYGSCTFKRPKQQ